MFDWLRTVFDWLRKIRRKIKKLFYNNDDYKYDNIEDWYALPTPEIFAPNKLIRYEFVKKIDDYIISSNDEQHGDELIKLAKVYMNLPDNIKRVIPIHGLTIDETLFEPSKIYVGKEGNTKRGAIQRYLKTLNWLFHGKTYDMSFIDLYLQNYVKDEKKREECMRVAMTFNRLFVRPYVYDKKYHEVYSKRNGMIIAYE